MKCLILFFFVSIFVTACRDGRAPEGVIENTKMISLLTDIHLIDSYFSSSGRYDSTSQPVNNYYRVVFKKYDTDSVQFQKSLRYYSANPDVLDTMYHQVLQKINRLEKIEVSKEQRKTKRSELLKLQKENAKIIFKPVPDLIFRPDTINLFNRSKYKLPVPLAL